MASGPAQRNPAQKPQENPFMQTSLLTWRYDSGQQSNEVSQSAEKQEELSMRGTMSKPNQP